MNEDTVKHGITSVMNYAAAPSSTITARVSTVTHHSASVHEERKAVSSDSPDTGNGHEGTRYVSTLCFPPHVLRNAEVLLSGHEDPEAEENEDSATHDVLVGVGQLPEREPHSLTICKDTELRTAFDAGNQNQETRTPITVTLLSGRWTQLNQVSLPNGQLDSNESSEYRIRYLTTREKTELAVQGQFGAACLHNGHVDIHTSQAEARADRDFDVGIAGLGQNGYIVTECKTLEETDSDDNETKHDRDTSDREEGSSLHSVLQMPSKNICPDKLCYISPVTSEEDNSDDQNGNRQYSFLDIFVKDYSSCKHCFAEQEHTSDAGREQHSNLTGFVEDAGREDYSAFQDEDGFENVMMAEHEDVCGHEATLCLEDVIRGKEDSTYREYMEIRFEYSEGNEITDRRDCHLHRGRAEIYLRSKAEVFPRQDVCSKQRQYSEPSQPFADTSSDCVDIFTASPVFRSGDVTVCNEEMENTFLEDKAGASEITDFVLDRDNSDENDDDEFDVTLKADIEPTFGEYLTETDNTNVLYTDKGSTKTQSEEDTSIQCHGGTSSEVEVGNYESSEDIHDVSADTSLGHSGSHDTFSSLGDLGFQNDESTRATADVMSESELGFLSVEDSVWFVDRGEEFVDVFIRTTVSKQVSGDPCWGSVHCLVEMCAR